VHASPFERLVREHQTMVWRYLRFLGCGPELAMDLTQDTFLRVIDVPVDRFGDDGASAYLRRVAKNVFLRRLEREGRRHEVSLESVDAAWDWFRREDDGASTMQALEACVAELPARSRRVLDLRFGRGLGRDAIAAEMAIGGFAVKSLLARTYARLRVCIERRIRDDEA